MKKLYKILFCIYPINLFTILFLAMGFLYGFFNLKWYLFPHTKPLSIEERCQVKTIEKLKSQRNRINELLNAPRGTLMYVGSDKVIATFKKRLKVLDKKIEKLEGEK